MTTKTIKSGATIEDLDAQGGFEMPLYDRGRQPANMPIAPSAPQPEGALGDTSEIERR